MLTQTCPTVVRSYYAQRLAGNRTANDAFTNSTMTTSGLNLIIPAGDRHHVSGYTFQELSEFKTVVLFPWNIELTTFAEMYAMAVPMFLPDRFWVARLWPKYPSAFAHKPNTHKHLANRPNVTNHKFTPYPDFAEIDTQFHIMYYWTQFSDFYRYPAVQHFTSFCILCVVL